MDLACGLECTHAIADGTESTQTSMRIFGIIEDYSELINRASFLDCDLLATPAMMKRELERLTDAAVDVDAPRQKRRKETSEDVVMGENSSPSVTEEGTKLWDVIRGYMKE